jgi:hypothetical protein
MLLRGLLAYGILETKRRQGERFIVGGQREPVNVREPKSGVLRWRRNNRLRIEKTDEEVLSGDAQLGWRQNVHPLTDFGEWNVWQQFLCAGRRSG